MMFEAKIILDSVNESGDRLTTFQLRYPRFIHSELMTHRVFSRNAMSSRAVPVAKMIAQVRDNPAKPIHWGMNKPGMQAADEVPTASAEHLWYKAANLAADVAEQMVKLNLHKQVANRILEPFQWMNTIVTATEWDNFYSLRAHPDAQPEFQKLAVMMLEAQKSSQPKLLRAGEWHLPYVTVAELEDMKSARTGKLHPFRVGQMQKVSAARCARVSYLTHDGRRPDVAEDLSLFDRLAGGVPLHASPLEHQGTPGTYDCGNFRGWTQFRKVWEKTM